MRSPGRGAGRGCGWAVCLLLLFFFASAPAPGLAHGAAHGSPGSCCPPGQCRCDEEGSGCGGCGEEAALAASCGCTLSPAPTALRAAQAEHEWLAALPSAWALAWPRGEALPRPLRPRAPWRPDPPEPPPPRRLS